mmetsp:Transcript_8374/g.29573  ORF Transcript_8374/g.29573 Transcript_8374/m.29573 type:complete len:101 (-) Transcript_8374:2-304(-)
MHSFWASRDPVWDYRLEKVRLETILAGFSLWAGPTKRAERMVPLFRPEKVGQDGLKDGPSRRPFSNGPRDDFPLGSLKNKTNGPLRGLLDGDLQGLCAVT